MDKNKSDEQPMGASMGLPNRVMFNQCPASIEGGIAAVQGIEQAVPADLEVPR